jgi:hypothetical protein
MCAGGCIGGCSCTSNSTALPIGNTGATGATGAQGLYGGFSGDWLFDLTNGGAPASTFLRFNGANVSANVTTITVAETGPSSVDYTSFLASLSNNSQYGYVRLFKETDSTAFWMGKITGVADSGLYATLTVTYITASDATTSNIFASSDSVVLTFSPSGAGTSLVLNNNTTTVSTVGAGLDALMSYNIPANTLKTNDDVIEIDAIFECSGTVDKKQLAFRIGGINFITKIASGTLILATGDKHVKVKIRLTRTSSTTLYVTVEMFKASGFYIIGGLNVGYSFDETMSGLSDFSTNTLSIACLGENSSWPSAASETIAQNQLLIRYFNK